MQNTYSLKKYACRAALAMAAICMPGLMYAGNVRQYTFAKGTKTYAALSNATKITPETWPTQCVIFPGADGVKVLAHKAQGFPIGFTFRFAGQDFDQFVPSNTGWILLGNGSVDFQGNGGSAFASSQVSELQGFYLGMNPIMYGTSDLTQKRGGSISYKTTGTEGQRVCTVQFEKMILDDESVAQDKGIYSVQVRLYEEDGRIEYAFREDFTTYCNGAGFYAGLHGWDKTDAMLISAKGLGKPTVVSAERDGSLLNPNTFIVWDENDADMGYSPVYTFTPVDATPAPEQAPTELKLKQQGKSMQISCRRAADAASTMILVSDRPFTSADLPVDSRTYAADAAGLKPGCKIGNATVVYYDDAETPSVTVNDLFDNATVYVKAISVNGYPAYGRDNTADAELITTQAAPEWVNATVEGNVVKLTWKTDFPVIVAATTQLPYHGRVYKGKFGMPESTYAVGDEIAEGGTVIYTGDAKEFTYVMNSDNKPVYFRVWSVNGTTVSAVGTDAAAVPAATYPFTPELETWPLYMCPMTWSTNSKDVGFFPAVREYASDLAVRGWSSGNPTTLTTPALPATEDATLKFEFAAETVRDPQPDPETGLMMLKGSEAGYFGSEKDAALTDEQGVFIDLEADGVVRNVARITKYNGAMVVFNNDDFNDDSSSYQAEEVNLGAIPANAKVTFRVCTGKTTKFFLRNISIVDQIANGVASAIDTAGANDIYSITGVKVSGKSLDELPAGLYIIGGKKYLKK